MSPARSILQPEHVRATGIVAGATVARHFYLLAPQFGDQVIEADGYRLGPAEAPDDATVVSWTIQFICPVCRQDLTLDALKKHIQVYRECGLETAEPIQCSYPAEFGGLCSFRAVLEPPRKQSDRVIRTKTGIEVRIDAIMRRA